jgi:hypothetical protein
MKIIKAILPYGLVSGKFSFKRWVKNFIPYGVVTSVSKSNQNKRFTVDYLKSKYVSDLSENEKWSLLALLLYLERTLGSADYLEVGIYAGGTIKFLKDNSTRSNFTGVDLFEDFKPSNDNTHDWKNYTQAQVWEALGKERVTLHKGFSVQCLADLQKEKKLFDLIFIDGNHTYKATKEDFEASLPLLKKNGYVAFHNCSPGASEEDKYYIKLDGGPWMLTHELLSNTDFKLVSNIDRIRIFQKTN